MGQVSLSLKVAILASLIVTGKTMAQSLPDEINHPRYLKIYQELEQVLRAKTAEYERLSAEKANIEKTISDMERDQVALPQRNQELARLIEMKRQEINRIQGEMSALETLLSRMNEDLRRFDAAIAQLQRDLNDQAARTQTIQVRRNQVAQNESLIRNRLEQKIAEERRSVDSINGLHGGINRDIQKRNQLMQERQELTALIERYKRELPLLKNKLSTNSQTVAAKRTQLAEHQNQISGIKQRIATEERNLGAINAEMAPKKSQLANLKAEMGRRLNEITKLQKEISELNAKIQSNQSRINSIDGLKVKRDNLEKEISSINSQITTLKRQVVDAKEEIKPDVDQLNRIKEQIRVLSSTGGNPPELERLKAQAIEIEKRVNQKRAEISRLERQLDNLNLSLPAKNQELTNLTNQINTAVASVPTLNAEIDKARNKISENQRMIDEQVAANAGMNRQIQELEGVIRGLEADRDRIGRNIMELKSQESSQMASIASLNREIQTIESDSIQVSRDITVMEKTIVDFPLNIRQIENHVQKINEQIQFARYQLVQEESRLSRIQQDKSLIERDLSFAQADLNRVNTELAQSNQVLDGIQRNLQQQTQGREAVVRYNQETINKYQSLKNQNQENQRTIDDSTQEIGVNNQDIRTISQQLPGLRNDLKSLLPRVSAAEKAMNDTRIKTSEADEQYQGRFSLYNGYLNEAKALGVESAKIGTADGMTSGARDSKLKATQLATESASSEAKWVGMRRAYVRGEVSGYQEGFQIGVSSTADANQGDIDGQNAGKKHAKDQANLVLKPEFYLEELDRRLKNDEVSITEMANELFMDEVKSLSSAKLLMQSDIPELTEAELQASSSITSPLDGPIEQSLIEANKVLTVRAGLANPRSVYTTPGAGVNANNASCSGVYKNVKDFIEACKTSHRENYQGLYVSAHQDSFMQEYAKAFADQITKTFDSELGRVYPDYFKEASKVAKNAGVSAGKKEIYRQSYERSEASAYASSIGAEEARVHIEAVALVDELLKGAAALTLKGEVKLSGDPDYGIAPGAEVDMKMVIKNIGHKDSIGNSLIKINQATANLILNNQEAAIPSVAAKSTVHLDVMKLKVSESAVPGSKVIISGEIVHPGNHYRSSRTENFQLETEIAVNPSIESTANFEATPKVSILGFKKKHEIDFTLSPKFEGVDKGYVISIEEAGSTFARFSDASFTTDRLNRGSSKTMTFKYKLNKKSRNKTIHFKITVKNGDHVVKTSYLQIQPQ